MSRTPLARECTCPQHGRWKSAEDIDRLVREIDVAINGQGGAAPQASLCDIAAQIKREGLVCNRHPLPTLDYSQITASIAETIAKVAKPLTRAQRDGLAPALAVWMEKVRNP